MNDLVANPNFPQLLVFPEGTTSRYDTLLRFKPGAFDFELPVQPVILHWRWNFYDPSCTAMTNLKYWSLQMLCQFYHYVEVEYLPTMVPDENEKHNPLFFANNARKIVFQALHRRAQENACSPGFSFNMHAVQQGVDDFLIWKRLLNAKLEDVHLTLQTFSIESIRQAIDFATPGVPTKRKVDLTFALASTERYLRIWHGSPMPGHTHKSFLSFSNLTQCILGDQAGSLAKETFLSAFSEAAIFPCSELEAYDFRQFTTALIWISNSQSIWGEPFFVFRELSIDPGVMKWASVRTRILFAFLCSQIDVMKDELSKDDVVKVLGNKASSLWDDLFFPIDCDSDSIKPSIADGEEKSIKISNDSSTRDGKKKEKHTLADFKDVVVSLLTIPFANNAPEEEDVLLKRKRSAYDLIELGFEKINTNFRSKYYEGGSLFLTEVELGTIQTNLVPLARKESIEDSIVDDPSENV